MSASGPSGPLVDRLIPSEMLTVDYIAKFGCNLISFLFI